MVENLKCMYCAEMGITNPNVFIEIVDVELGHGWICKECFIESEKEKENLLIAELQSIKERNKTLEDLEVFRVEELTKLDDLRVENTKLKKQLKRKEQECEELKEAQKNSRCAWKSLEGTFCPQAQEQLEAYKMEAEEGKEINAELKSENDEYYLFIEKLCDYAGLECDNEEQAMRTLLNLASQMNKARWIIDRYKQTLTEIKEIVFPKNQLIITDSPIILKIQEKISEVEE